MSTKNNKQQAQPQVGPIAQQLAKIQANGYPTPSNGQQPSAGQPQKRTPNWTGFSSKTLWDWLQLLGVLAVPLVVAGATFLFSTQQAQLTDLQHQNDLRIAQDNRQNDLKIADDQQQETTLKAYLDDMTILLLDKKFGSQTVADKAASAEAAVVARAKTLIALRRLTNPQRKAAVVQFLYEARLVGYCPTVNCVGPLIDLSRADLYEANLRGAKLSGVDLGEPS